MRDYLFSQRICIFFSFALLGLRPTLPSGMPPLLGACITDMWQGNYFERPSFETIVSFLTAFHCNHEQLLRDPSSFSTASSMSLSASNDSIGSGISRLSL